MVRDLFCVSDFVINDSKKYLNSGVLREALSYGKPILTYSYGAVVDMAIGSMIDLYKYDSLKHLVRYLTHMDDSTYQSLSNHAIARDSERSWDVSSQFLNEEYKRYLESSESK